MRVGPSKASRMPRAPKAAHSLRPSQMAEKKDKYRRRISVIAESWLDSQVLTDRRLNTEELLVIPTQYQIVRASRRGAAAPA